MNPQISYLLNLSVQQIQTNRLNDAEHTLNQIIKIQPKNADALCFLSVVFAYKLDYENALNYINKSIEHNPKNSIALSNKGNILKELGRNSEAVMAYEKAILIDSKNHEAFNNLGNLKQDDECYVEAITSYKKAIDIYPAYAEAYSNMGNALEKVGRYQESLDMFDRAIALNPNYVDALLNRCFTLNKLKRYLESLESCEKALRSDRSYPFAWMVKGIIASEQGFYEQSINFFDEAISADPKYWEAWACRGSSLVELKKYEEALSSYETAYAGNPNFAFLFGDIINLKQLVALWFGLDEQIDILIEDISTEKKVIQPFKFLSVEDSPVLALKVARKWVNYKFPTKNLLPKIEKKTHQKIRIGYFSSDLKYHPVALLLAELFELHDRNKFEIFAFSLQPASPNDELRPRLRNAFDHFFDVEAKSEIEIAQLARELQIDIALDLGGHTKFAPTGVMSYRAAPIQINYFGFPGTMGAEYMDYIIADQILIPEEDRENYTEKVIYLPNTYMVDDSGRIPSAKNFTRSECGLPADGFVFCCFNNSYKFNKSMFQSWVRILEATPKGVLWVSENNEFFRKNLTKEFLDAGISVDRIVFADRLNSMADHLARLKVADLFLDTKPYNAHSTTLDSLKAGVPVLTLIGKSFAARVAASILSAIGLQELIANSFSEYEKMAIDLGNSADKLKKLKDKLAKNKETTALFDTARYVRNIESAYFQVYERYLNEQSANHLLVSETQA